MSFEFELHKDGLFVIPSLDGEPYNGLLIPGVTKSDLQFWVKENWCVEKEWYNIEITHFVKFSYYIANRNDALPCGEDGEPLTIEV